MADISYITKKYLVLLLGAVFVVSFGFSLYYKIRPTVDAKAYNNIAWNLARGNGYIEDQKNAATPERDDAIVRVGPGYEFFLAGTYVVFGHHIWIVWLLQALLRVGTVYILFRMAMLLLTENSARESIGLLAAAFFGFMPDLIILSGMLLAETLYLFMCMLALYVSLRALEANKTPLFASISWGIAALVRPTALAVAILYAIGAYIIKRKVFLVISILLFPFLFLGAWSLRNSLLFNKPLFTTTAGAYALWVGNNPDAIGGFDKTPEIQKIRDGHHSVELSEIGMQKYFDFLRENPLQFMALQIKKTSMYFSIVRPTGFWFFLMNKPAEQLLTLVFSALATAFLFIVGGAGMCLYATRREKYAWFLVSTALLQPLTVIPLYVETRYRAPFFPFLAFFAAYTLYMLWQYRKESASYIYRALCIVGILVLLLTLSDAIYSYNVIMERLHSLFMRL